MGSHPRLAVKFHMFYAVEKDLQLCPRQGSRMIQNCWCWLQVAFFPVLDFKELTLARVTIFTTIYLATIGLKVSKKLSVL